MSFRGSYQTVDLTFVLCTVRDNINFYFTNRKKKQTGNDNRNNRHRYARCNLNNNMMLTSATTQAATTLMSKYCCTLQWYSKDNLLSHYGEGVCQEYILG